MRGITVGRCGGGEKSSSAKTANSVQRETFYFSFNHNKLKIHKLGGAERLWNRPLKSRLGKLGIKEVGI